jgi:hypothetical protein
MFPPRTVVAYLSFTSGQDAGTHLVLHSFDRQNDSKADNNCLKSSETAEKQGRDSKSSTTISKRQGQKETPKEELYASTQ